MTRDLDLIAVPWRGGAVSARGLIESLAAAVGAKEVKKPARKPFGRRAWVIVISPEQALDLLYLDVSVMPRRR